jgi:hypothetical protein
MIWLNLAKYVIIQNKDGYISVHLVFLDQRMLLKEKDTLLTIYMLYIQISIKMV